MYLVTLYFDEKTNEKICELIAQAAEASGNTDMLDHSVPPHITLAVFESKEKEEVLVQRLDAALEEVASGKLMWVSVAAFFPHILFLAPVLNEYLSALSEKVCCSLEVDETTKVQECYRPYNWLPHTTVARKLSKRQMQEAFVALQECFHPFEGNITRIGLSTGSPKREFKYWEFL